MKIIGITGKSGSGKTTFASLLAQKLNCKHIDIDPIGHEALFQPEIFDSLCEKFGRGILDENGKVDRKRVGEVVFSQKQKMDELTELTWGYMQKILDEILIKNDDIIILDWILLPNSKYWKMCDLKILVTSDENERKQKILKRDNISEEYLEKRESASFDYSTFEFDYIFENDYKVETMKKIIEEIKEKNIHKLFKF